MVFLKKESPQDRHWRTFAWKILSESFHYCCTWKSHYLFFSIVDQGSFTSSLCCKPVRLGCIPLRGNRSPCAIKRCDYEGFPSKKATAGELVAPLWLMYYWAISLSTVFGWNKNLHTPSLLWHMCDYPCLRAWVLARILWLFRSILLQ